MSPPDPAKAPASAAPGALFSGWLWKTGVALAFMLGLLALVYLSPVHDYLGQLSRIRADLSQFGWGAPAMFGLACVFLVAAGVPRLLLCGVGATLFGFWPGLVCSQLGALIGNYLVFNFARWAGHDLLARLLPRTDTWSARLNERGIAAVILARQLPIPGILVNLLLGTLNLRHRDFLLGTALGLLPEAIPAALMGSGFHESSLVRGAWLIGAAVILLCGVWLALAYGRQNLAHSQTPITPSRERA